MQEPPTTVLRPLLPESLPGVRLAACSGAAEGQGGDTPLRVSDPYTHQVHARRCREAAHQHQVLKQYVQARYGFTSCCASIAAAWDTPDGLQMWSLDLLGPIRGRLFIPANRTRQCSGLDGHCTCAGESVDRAGFSPHEASDSTPQGVTC